MESDGIIVANSGKQSVDNFKEEVEEVDKTIKSKNTNLLEELEVKAELDKTSENSDES